MVSRKTLKFYGIWTLVAVALMSLVLAILFSLEWRPVYQYEKWYRNHPAEEEHLTAWVVRNSLGNDWIRIFVNGTDVRLADRDEKAPPGVEVVYREYSYRLVFPDGGSIDIYGSGPDVRQVRLLSGCLVEVIGKRVWFDIQGVKVKEEFWPKRIRVSDQPTEQHSVGGR